MITVVYIVILINAHPVLVYYIDNDAQLARMWTIVNKSDTTDLYKPFVYLLGRFIMSKKLLFLLPTIFLTRGQEESGAHA